MSLKNNHINNILAKFSADEELSFMEKEHLNVWKKENEQEFLHLEQLLNKKNQTFKVDTEDAWQKVLAKKAKKQHPNKQFSILPKSILSYGMVASLIFILGVSAWFYLGKDYIEYHNATLEAQTYTLPDNSDVSLNSKTTIRYYNKTKQERKLKLVAGEVFCNVSPNKQRPFIIETNNATVRVVGTSFNVKTTDSITDVSVKTGIVALTNKNNDKVKLVSGERGTATLENIVKTKLKNENYLAWKTKVLSFKNSSLADVIPALEDFFHVKITAPETAKNCYFTTSFTTESLKEALEELKLLVHFEYQINGKNVVLTSINCD